MKVFVCFNRGFNGEYAPTFFDFDSAKSTKPDFIFEFIDGVLTKEYSLNIDGVYVEGKVLK